MSTATIARYQSLELAKRHRPKWGEPGSKVARKVTALVWSQGKHRPVVVAVYPDGVIGYRLLGERREFYRAAAEDYREAVRLTKAAERAAKRKARKK